MRTFARRWLLWVVLAVVLVVALAIGASRASSHPTTEQRVRHITGQLRCPVCDGETVAESNAVISQDIRILVQQRVEQGQSDHQITDYVVQQYPGTLLTPPATGVGIIVWALPVLVFVAAAAVLVFTFVRWRARGDVTVSDADRALVEEAMRR